MTTEYYGHRVVKKGRNIHNAALIERDSGYGSTSCGIRIMPADKIEKAVVDCKTCRAHMDGTWLRKMAKLEEGCDVSAGGGMARIKKTLSQKKHRHRWAKPHLMSTVGLVKACRAKGCPIRMKAVRPKESRVSGGQK